MTDVYNDRTVHAPDNARGKAVDLVRKMLAKASDPAASPAEAEAFEAKALEIMHRHAIEERELRDTSPHVKREVPIPTGHARLGYVKLLHGLANQSGVFSLWYGYQGKVHLYGTEPAIDDTLLIFDHLMPQLLADLAADKPRSRKSYAAAWAGRVLARLRDAQARTYEASTALVPTTHQAERFAKEQGIRWSNGPKFHPDYADASAGRDAGDRATLAQKALR